MGQLEILVRLLTIPLYFAVKLVVQTPLVQHLDTYSRIWNRTLICSSADYTDLIRMICVICGSNGSCRTLLLYFLCRNKMLAIRLYISTLTILFTALVIASRGLGILEAVVITCAVVYLIIDTRIDLQSVKGELVLLKELEKYLLRYTAK